MTSDRLDRIDLLLYRMEVDGLLSVSEVVEALNLISEEIRYLHNRPLADQISDSQELLKESN